MNLNLTKGLNHSNYRQSLEQIYLAILTFLYICYILIYMFLQERSQISEDGTSSRDLQTAKCWPSVPRLPHPWRHIPRLLHLWRHIHRPLIPSRTVTSIMSYVIQMMTSQTFLSRAPVGIRTLGTVRQNPNFSLVDLMCHVTIYQMTASSDRRRVSEKCKYEKYSRKTKCFYNELLFA